MNIPHDATECDYLKAILELLVAIAERQIDRDIIVRVTSKAADGDWASERTQPKPQDNVKILAPQEIA